MKAEDLVGYLRNGSWGVVLMDGMGVVAGCMWDCLSVCLSVIILATALVLISGKESWSHWIILAATPTLKNLSYSY